jgi:hypothetical protein
MTCRGCMQCNMLLHHQARYPKEQALTVIALPMMPSTAGVAAMADVEQQYTEQAKTAEQRLSCTLTAAAVWWDSNGLKPCAGRHLNPACKAAHTCYAGGDPPYCASTGGA